MIANKPMHLLCASLYKWLASSSRVPPSSFEEILNLNGWPFGPIVDSRSGLNRNTKGSGRLVSHNSSLKESRLVVGRKYRCPLLGDKFAFGGRQFRGKPDSIKLACLCATWMVSKLELQVADHGLMSSSLMKVVSVARTRVVEGGAAAMAVLRVGQIRYGGPNKRITGTTGFAGTASEMFEPGG